MERSNFSQEFKKLDLQEQATFLVLGAVDTVFHTLTNTFTAVSEASDAIGNFARDGGKDALSKESVTDMFGIQFKTDKVNRPETAAAENGSKATSIPVTPPKASPIAIKKS